jgi:hypothetical protein
MVVVDLMALRALLSWHISGDVSLDWRHAPPGTGATLTQCATFHREFA